MDQTMNICFLLFSVILFDIILFVIILLKRFRDFIFFLIYFCGLTNANKPDVELYKYALMVDILI